MAFNYRMGIQTVSNIVLEVCDAVWEKLSGSYMKMPETEEDWKLIAGNFEQRWNFPHCIGALDGKHVVMKCPSSTGSLYYNYKGTFSMVLLALVDAQYKFICIDIGSYGRNSDGGIFSHSSLGKALSRNLLTLPPNEAIDGAEELGPLPYVIVGDEAFPLQEHLLRPFPGRGCPADQQAFNYRLSRARRVVENAFGILAARWRVFNTRIAVRPELVRSIVKAACCLHNMLQCQSTPTEVTSLLSDHQGHSEGIQSLRPSGNRHGQNATRIRNLFKEYFVEYSPLSWQNAHINRGKFV